MIADVIISCIICPVVCFQRIPNCSLELVGLKLRMYGAQITGSFDSKVTHVILDGRLLQFSYLGFCNAMIACLISLLPRSVHVVLRLYTMSYDLAGKEQYKSFVFTLQFSLFLRSRSKPLKHHRQHLCMCL